MQRVSRTVTFAPVADANRVACQAEVKQAECQTSRSSPQALVLALFLTLALCCPLLAATPDLSGNWVCEIQATEISNGTPGYYRMTLNQDGSELSGSLEGGSVSGSVKPSGEFEIRTPDQTWQGSIQGDEFTATTTSTDRWRQPLSIRAWREEPPPSQPRTHAFEPTEFHLFYTSSVPAALHISPGDTVKTETIDATGVDAKGRHRSGGGNPQTGPFYIEGALPGDTLAIQLTKFQLNRDTAITTNTILPNAVEANYLSQLDELNFSRVTWKLDHASALATLENPTDRMKNYSVKLSPFLGAIAVAPPQRAAIRSTNSGRYGGNLDYNRLVEGTTVYLPVFHPGALLFIGDGHAAQGDGELAGNALETSLDVEFRVEVIRDTSPRMPRAENKEELMASGIAGSLDRALQFATTNMSRWLQEKYKLDRYELSSVLGTAMSYDIAEIVGTEYHVVARMNKSVLVSIASAANDRPAGIRYSRNLK